MRRASVAVITWLPSLMALALLVALSRRAAIALSDRRAAQAHGQAGHREPGSGAEQRRSVPPTDAGHRQASQVGVTSPA